MTRFHFPVRSLHIPMQEFASELEHAVDHFFNRPNTGTNGSSVNGENTGAPIDFNPAMDVKENEASYRLELDLPGVQLEDVKLEVHDDRLSVSGKRSTTEGTENWSVKRSERPFGNYRRILALPKNADVERIEAILQDGVLLITIPKSLAAQPRQIDVKRITTSAT